MRVASTSLGAAFVLSIAASATTALAQPAATPPAVPASPAPSVPSPPDEHGATRAKRDEALTHFELGLTHFDREEWSAALAEFLRAREIYPTRSATKNAAICFRKENRFDEALDMFEALERDYPDLSDADRALAAHELAELRRSVGALFVRGGEPGASIIVDGRSRGTLPLAAALRVGVGSHVVRVYKEGFVPFERRVDIASQQPLEIVAALGALTRSGRLRVNEEGGAALDVVIDDAVVGKTPWEGTVTPGQHVVFLRGEGNVGTQPASAPVALDQVTPITLVAGNLDASARIDPTPGGALVAIDGVFIGRGVWEGRLRSGAHRIEVTAEGFLPVARDVVLRTNERQAFVVALDRDPGSPLWGHRSRSHFVVEVSGSFVLSPTLGGQVDGTCTGSCSATLPLGGLGVVGVSYQLPQGLGFGVQGGYLAFAQSVEGRPATISGPELIPGASDHGTLNDRLTLQGLLLGGSVFYRIGDAWPLTLSVGIGAYLSSVSDERTGDFKTTVSRDVPPGTPYSVNLSESHGGTFLYASPEVRFGRRLGDHLELSAGVTLLVMAALSQPGWTDESEVRAGPPGKQGDGLGVFGAQTLTGAFVLAVAPGFGARYEF
jgi:hypothetical protein